MILSVYNTGYNPFNIYIFLNLNVKISIISWNEGVFYFSQQKKFCLFAVSNGFFSTNIW